MKQALYLSSFAVMCVAGAFSVGRADEAMPHRMYQTIKENLNRPDAADQLRELAAQGMVDLSLPFADSPCEMRPSKAHFEVLPFGVGIKGSKRLDPFDSGLHVTDGRVMCFISLCFDATANTILSFLDRNVRVYELSYNLTLLAAVPVEELGAIEALDTVWWMGEFKPEHKYIANRVEPKAWRYMIYSIDGDKPEFRRDFEALGVENPIFRRKINPWSPYGGLVDLYWVTLLPEQVSAVAELWWVAFMWKEDVIRDLAGPGEPSNSPLLPTGREGER